MSNCSQQFAKGFLPLVLGGWLVFLLVSLVAGQAGTGHTIFGDFKVDESQASPNISRTYQLLLYNTIGNLMDRQSITSNGRFRFFNLGKLKDAEKACLRAIDEKPTFILPLLNLAKIRMANKNYEGAIEALDGAIKIEPTNAMANYLLGEAYLQIKKGSKAVGYLYQALKLDPNGMAEAHLRLAVLYNGAGMKDKAAVEYELFLKKKPDYQERKKLEAYIEANKPKTSVKQ